MKSSHITQPQFAMIWFGAALSVAEIMTGTSLSPLGFLEGIYAILLGHIIGGTLLFGAGYIGAQLKKSSMETTSYSFGVLGSKWFALLNIIQLFGWTSIMIYDSTLTLEVLSPHSPEFWSIGIGSLIIFWLFIGLRNKGYIQVITSILLIGLTIYISQFITLHWQQISHAPNTHSIDFINALELSIAMPLSWLPLISDYTSQCKKPFMTSLISSTSYTLTSTIMYILGICLGIFNNSETFTELLKSMNFGVISLLIIILSTVTTTFMDAYSAGVSSKTLYHKLPHTIIAIIVTILSTVAALLYPMDNITNFLYLIGSVFTPMISILLVDFFICRKPAIKKTAIIIRFLIWLISVCFYHYMLYINFRLGATLPTFSISLILTVIVHYASMLNHYRKSYL